MTGLALCALSFLICGAVSAGDAVGRTSHPQRRVVGIYLNHGGAALSVAVNGVDLYIYDNAKPHAMGAAVNQWVRTGENKFSVKLSSPAVAPDGVKPYFEVLIKYAGVKGPEGLIREWRWPPDGQEASLPFENEISFSVSQPGLGGYGWEKAKPVKELKDSVLSDLRSAVASYYAQFTSGDIGKMLSATKSLNREIANSYGLSEKENEAKAKARFEKNIGRKWLPLNVDTLVFRSQADGRLFKVLTSSGTMPIASIPDETGFQEGYQMYLAYIGGKWVWVR